MQVDSPEKIRNIAVAGHNDTGKTTLVSALLYTGGVTTRFTRVEDGNTITDFDHEETERGISIGLAPCFVPWQQNKINLIDCPGYGIFFTETKANIQRVMSGVRRRGVRGVHKSSVDTEARESRDIHRRGKRRYVDHSPAGTWRWCKGGIRKVAGMIPTLAN